MACLFCGKEIGPIRLLRDKEFCSPKHRKEYKDRLRRVLVQVGEPQTVPTGMASFLDATRPSERACRRAEASFHFSSGGHRAKLPISWTLTVPEAGSSLFARLELTARELSTPTPGRAFDAEAIAYFGSSTVNPLLTLPDPKIGAVVLRSTDGQLLSEPVALRYPEAHTASQPAPLPAPLPLPKPVAGLALPGFGLAAADCTEMARAADPAPSEAWMPSAAPVPSLPIATPFVNVPVPAALHLPAMLPEPAVAAPPAADEFETPPPAYEKPMAGLRPDAVVRMVQAIARDAMPAHADLRLPSTLSAQSPALRPEAHLSHLEGPAPEAANSEFRMASPVCSPIAPAALAPPLGAIGIANPALPAGRRDYLALSESQPVEREITPATNLEAAAFSAMPLRLAPFAIEAAHDPAPDAIIETPAKPAAAKKPTLRAVDSAPTPVRKPAEPALAAPMPLPPVAAAQQMPAEVPQAGLLPVDYHSPIGPMQPQVDLSWKSRPSNLALTRFAVRPVFDRLEDPSKQKEEERKRPAFAEIFTMPDAAALTKRRGARHAFTAIAASVTVAMALWFGANAGKFGKDLLTREAAEEIAAARTQTQSARSAGSASASTAVAPPEPSALSHPVAWIRTEAAKRATVKLADSFDNGMQAWGAKARALAPGWSRSSDGYVRPGALALFQPTLSYTDYRMEFFGQIEDKSMSWVVRGKDTKNYYAMKFHITEPGLRPVIAMVHYPVVGGKQGHKVEVPLSVMVHNNTPYHVAVDVRGSHFTASIEGQEVDSWSDDTLLAGGVGFFAEAGSKARIYWMKVSKNDDWFGRLCNSIAGNPEPSDTARLDRPAVPVPQPDQPSPAPATAALWPAEPSQTGFARPQREKGSLKGEMERWSS